MEKIETIKDVISFIENIKETESDGWKYPEFAECIYSDLIEKIKKKIGVKDGD